LIWCTICTSHNWHILTQHLKQCSILVLRLFNKCLQILSVISHVFQILYFLWKMVVISKTTNLLSNIIIEISLISSLAYSYVMQEPKLEPPLVYKNFNFPAKCHWNNFGGFYIFELFSILRQWFDSIRCFLLTFSHGLFNGIKFTHCFLAIFHAIFSSYPCINFIKGPIH